jgi:hypothetical protein
MISLNTARLLSTTESSRIKRGGEKGVMSRDSEYHFHVGFAHLIYLSITLRDHLSSASGAWIGGE